MAMQSAAELMDRQYRFQRHIYDATRTHYLLWRRRLITELQPPRGGNVVEVACGTGWNLVRGARRYPATPFYGFDISREMLSTASHAIARNELSARVSVAPGDATDFDLRTMFGIETADRIFISYALSMIPSWHLAVYRSLAQLAPGGSLHVVDFGRMDSMPAAPRAAFLKFLAHYNVTPRRDMETALAEAAHRFKTSLSFEESALGYSAYAVLKRV
jgi:S-adenosylmethionine-diacylgycerolhomoserine-N-methlytransferase